MCAKSDSGREEQDECLQRSAIGGFFVRLQVKEQDPEKLRAIISELIRALDERKHAQHDLEGLLLSKSKSGPKF
jgi:hypothetical protein